MTACRGDNYPVGAHRRRRLAVARRSPVPHRGLVRRRVGGCHVVLPGDPPLRSGGLRHRPPSRVAIRSKSCECGVGRPRPAELSPRVGVRRSDGRISLGGGRHHPARPDRGAERTQGPWCVFPAGDHTTTDRGRRCVGDLGTLLERSLWGAVVGVAAHPARRIGCMVGAFRRHGPCGDRLSRVHARDGLSARPSDGEGALLGAHHHPGGARPRHGVGRFDLLT